MRLFAFLFPPFPLFEMLPTGFIFTSFTTSPVTGAPSFGADELASPTVNPEF